MKNRLAAMIMAAGESRRFDGCKQLASLGEKTVLQRVVDVASCCFADHIYVVTGRYHEAIKSQIQHAHCIYNPGWREGLGKSISHGVTGLAEKYDGILILLGDQVALESGHLEEFVDRFDNEKIVCAHYSGKNGVPALFPRLHYSDLMSLSGETGAKALLNQQNNPVISIDMKEAAIDIDTRDSLDLFIREEKSTYRNSVEHRISQ